MWQIFFRNTLPTMVEKIPDIPEELIEFATNFFIGRGKKPAFYKNSCPDVIWKDDGEKKSELERWKILIEAVFSVPTTDFYNYNDKGESWFQLGVFDEIIQSHVSDLTLQGHSYNDFFGILKYFVGLRLQVAILVEKPPFPEKIISSPPSELFATFVAESCELAGYQDADNLTKEVLPSFGRSAAKRSTIFNINHKIVVSEIIRCGTRNSTPLKAWTGEDNGGLANSIRKALAGAAAEKRGGGIFVGVTQWFMRTHLIRNLGVGQFDARVAMLILLYLKIKYNHSNRCIVDPTAGWGDRLVAALAYMKIFGQPHEYWAIDQNPALGDLYLKIIEALYPEVKERVKIRKTCIEHFQDSGLTLTDQDTILTSPPYVVEKAVGLVERYPGLDHGAFELDLWWQTVMWAVVNPGAPREKAPSADGVMIALIVNKYMRKRLEETHLKNLENIAVLPYPVGKMKRSNAEPAEVILIYRRSPRFFPIEPPLASPVSRRGPARKRKADEADEADEERLPRQKRQRKPRGPGLFDNGNGKSLELGAMEIDLQQDSSHIGFKK